MSWEYKYHDDDDSDSASVVSNDSSLVSVVSGSAPNASVSSQVSFEDDDVNTLMETTREELEDLACMVLDGNGPVYNPPDFRSSKFFAMAEAQLREDTDRMIAQCLQQEEDDVAMMYEDDLEFEARDLIIGQDEHAGRHRGIQGSSHTSFKSIDIEEGFDRLVLDGYINQDGKEEDRKMPAKEVIVSKGSQPAAKLPSGQGVQGRPNEVAPSERMSKNGPEPIENGPRLPDITAVTVHVNGGSAGLPEDQGWSSQTSGVKTRCPTDNQGTSCTSRMDDQMDRAEVQGCKVPVACGTEATEKLKWWDLDSSSRRSLVRYVLRGGDLDIYKGDAWTDIHRKLLTIAESWEFHRKRSSHSGELYGKPNRGDSREQEHMIGKEGFQVVRKVEGDLMRLPQVKE
jgi:hypothetical protein